MVGNIKMDSSGSG